MGTVPGMLRGTLLEGGFAFVGLIEAGDPGPSHRAAANGPGEAPGTGCGGLYP